MFPMRNLARKGLRQDVFLRRDDMAIVNYSVLLMFRFARQQG